MSWKKSTSWIKSDFSPLILVYLWVSASGIASRCHFTEDKFCLCSTPTEISPQPGHLQKASSDSSIVITESGRREKQECCTEVYSLMWNLIEHDSTEICHCNGDELVFQVHQQLSKRHSTLTSLHWADTTVANVPPPQSSSHSVGLVLDSMQICIPSKLFMLVFKLIFFFFWCRDLLGMSFPFQSSKSLCVSPFVLFMHICFPFLCFQTRSDNICTILRAAFAWIILLNCKPTVQSILSRIYKWVFLLRRRSRLTPAW